MRGGRGGRGPSPPPAASVQKPGNKKLESVSGPPSAPSRPAPWATDTIARSAPRVSSTYLDAAQMPWNDVVVGDVTALAMDPEGSCVGLVIDGDVVRADAVVVAIGPWTNRVVSASLVRECAAKATTRC